MPSAPVRVLLANDHEMILQGLRAMLAPFAPQLVVVGCARRDDDILRQAEQTAADLVLLDVFLRPSGGVALASRLAAQVGVRVAIFTYEDHPALVAHAVDVGVAGYLLKSVSAEQLARDLVRVAHGEVVVHVDPSGSPSRAWPGASVGLTRRESEVLALLVEGRTKRQAAELLFVGEETVKTHLRGVYRKLGVGDRVAAVSRAWREGWWSQPPAEDRAS